MRALVLSSGGSRGYYHLGALQYLYQEQKLQHDIICGTSLGALMGAFIAQYPRGQEAFAINDLCSVFDALTTKDVYTRWRPFGKLHALFNKRSLYDSAPLKNLISTHIDQCRIIESKRKLRIGVTLFAPNTAEALCSNNYKVYTEQDSDLHAIIKASSALTPFFEPVKLHDGLAVDGGIQTVTPIKAAIDAGATVIDAIICYPKHLVYPKTTRKNTVVTDLLYCIDLMVNRITWLDVSRVLEINALVRAGQSDKRIVEINIINPAADLNVNALEFESQQGKRLQLQGWEDAEASLRINARNL